MRTVTERLSTLDASFLAVECPDAHMHVGWKATFAAPARGARPPFAELRDHIEARLGAAPRYRQRLASVPLGAHHPVWVDDPSFDIRRHVREAPPRDLDDLVADVMSEPLHRDRPLWELWLCEQPAGGLAMVGKAHHCMVDGLGAVELTSLLLDAEPDPGPRELPETGTSPSPGALELLTEAVRDTAADAARLARAVATPWRLAEPVATGLVALAHAVAPVAPRSPLNRASSPHRKLGQLCRELDELRAVRHAFGVTVNDVLLAAVAGALRGFLAERDEEPREPLKVMVPVSRRQAGDDPGNHISFVFVQLPCDRADPADRLAAVAGQMRASKDAREPDGAEAALRGAALAPRFVQSLLARALASPRVFNLVVSNVPGPPIPLFLRGLELREVYPVVPLAKDHALSVGMMTVAGKACFGLYADRRTLPDVDAFAGHLDRALDELVALAERDTRLLTA